MTSLARAGPTSLGRRCVPPAPGMTPSLIPGRPDLVACGGLVRGGDKIPGQFDVDCVHGRPVELDDSHSVFDAQRDQICHEASLRTRPRMVEVYAAVRSGRNATSASTYLVAASRQDSRRRRKSWIAP